MNEHLLPALCVSSLALPMAAAQGPDELPSSPPNLERLVETWREAKGASWKVAADPATGYLEMLYGGSALPVFEPRSDAEWYSVGRVFLTELEPLHGLAGGQLVDDRVHLLPLGMTGGVDKMTVRYRQELAGIPVVGGTVNLLFDLSGRLLSVQSTAAPRLFGPVDANVSADAAGRTAIRDFADRHGLRPIEVGQSELVFRQIDRGRRIARLAWQQELAWHAEGAYPIVERVWVDAVTDAVIDVENLVHQFDVDGTVTTMATPGTFPDIASNPEVQMAVPYVRVDHPGGSVFADANGEFTVPGTSPVDVTVRYVGLFNQVFNDAGDEYVLNASLSDGGGLLMNPASSDEITAQANAYIHVNTVRDFIRAADPGDSTADFLVTSNTNLDSTCNAFFDGSSVNYFAAGGGCPNTAYSSIIAHEYGHWLNVLYDTHNRGDGMGEGNADVFAMYTFDDPVVGHDFCGTGCIVRTGTNTTQFCGDDHPGCYFGEHVNGRVWMGAAWKIRRNLNTTHGNSLGDMIADTLFIGWLNAYDQTRIRSIIEAQWLTLDDDDGNIDNSTPNYSDIDAAFREQGFPGYDLPPMQFVNVTQIPDSQDETGPYAISAEITPVLAPPVVSAAIHYRVNGGTFSSVPMSNVSGDTWSGSIPGQLSPARVDYYLEGTNSVADRGRFPAGAPAETLTFHIGVLSTFFVNEFEGGTNEGWTVGDVGDAATRGIWERVDPVATIAQPGDDHTDGGALCWVTGQQPAGGSVGTNDVDGGRTTLKSPVFDASNLNDPWISYWRWYSNDAHMAPGADIFEVDITNDGSTWVEVESVGPTGPHTHGGWFRHEFRVVDKVALSSTMRMRFVASDLGSDSNVEAALDDIEGSDVGPVEGPGTTYCVGAVNSTGVGASIAAEGSNVVADNDLTLVTEGLPVSVPGLYFFGSSQVEVAFGDGFRCAGGTVKRVQPASFSDGSGTVSRTMNLAAPPLNAHIFSGVTTNWQFWYRDTAAGMSGFNLSNGYEIVWQ